MKSSNLFKILNILNLPNLFGEGVGAGIKARQDLLLARDRISLAGEKSCRVYLLLAGPRNENPVASNSGRPRLGSDATGLLFRGVRKVQPREKSSRPCGAAGHWARRCWSLDAVRRCESPITTLDAAKRKQPGSRPAQWVRKDLSPG